MVTESKLLDLREPLASEDVEVGDVCVDIEGHARHVASLFKAVRRSLVRGAERVRRIGAIVGRHAADRIVRAEHLEERGLHAARIGEVGNEISNRADVASGAADSARGWVVQSERCLILRGVKQRGG